MPLPRPDLTLLLDISPDVSLARKQAGRDKYERDLPLLSRVRASYIRQAGADEWATIDATRDRLVVSSDVLRAVSLLLSP